MKIYPNWYKINDIWYHCITDYKGNRFINGVKQLNEDTSSNT